MHLFLWFLADHDSAKHNKWELMQHTTGKSTHSEHWIIEGLEASNRPTHHYICYVNAPAVPQAEEVIAFYCHANNFMWDCPVLHISDVAAN